MIKIDKLYYINLDKRVDRKIHIQKIISQIQIDKQQRVSAFEAPGNGSWGCALSHIKALQDARDGDYENIMILEDDFMAHDLERLNTYLGQFFQSNIDYDVLMVSGNIKKYHSTQNTGIIKVIEAQTASGYCVNKKFYNKLIANFKESADNLKNNEGVKWKYAIDQNWKSLQTSNNFLAFFPLLGKQIEGFSDIENKHTNYNC